MNAGYYKTTITAISDYRPNISKWLYSNTGGMIASLWFVDSRSKQVWDQSHTALPADDPDVVAAVAAFPAMEIK